MHVSLSAELEIQRRFEAFAAVRLSPTARASAGMRARIMREARLAFAERTQAAAPIAGIDERRRPRRTSLMRRGAGLLVAAGLTLTVAGGAMAASQAGGPLYGTRMWLETVTLPAGGTARADAEIARLEERLREVVAAAENGDPRGVAAALSAYQDIVDEAVAGAAADEIAMEHLAAALDRHVAVLEAVAAKVPAEARASIERNIARTIQHNEARLDRIQGQGGGRPAGNQGGGNGTPTGGPPATSPAGTPGEPADTSEPTATAKPTKPPRPTPDPPEAGGPPPTPPAAEPPKGPPSPKPDKTPGQGNSGQP